MTNSWKSIIPIKIKNYELSDNKDKSMFLTYSELNETTLPSPPLDENSATNAVSRSYALGVTLNP
jgi:hypothetical protein